MADHNTGLPAAISEKAVIREDTKELASATALSVSDVETGTTSTLVGDRPEAWNFPRRNIYKTFATFWSFIVMGLNDATYGAIITYLQDFYNLDYSIVSLVFLSPFVGYIVSALINHQIHSHYGQRGVAVLVAVCQVIAYAIICLHPPFPVVVLAYILAGLGNGLQDSSWNAWAGSLPNSNEVLGFLHGSYGIGALLAPLVATPLIVNAGWEWYQWYYIMTGVAIAGLGVGIHAFWHETGLKYRQSHAHAEEDGSTLKQALVRMPVAKIVWLCALFTLSIVGIEVTIGGWIVDFMQKVRGATDFESGMADTAYWTGMTLGPVVLGFITGRLGVTLATSMYIPITMALELIFWLVPDFKVSFAMVAIQGFFIGPLFPAAIVVCTNLLPKHLRITACGFVAAFGGSGGALFPYAVGAIAQKLGVKVLQPVVIILLVAAGVLWLCLPKIDRKLQRSAK